MIVQYYKLPSKFHHRPHIICLCVNDVKWWTQHMCPLIKGWALLGGGKGSRFEGHVIIISSSVSLHIISKDQESQDCFDFDLLAAPKKMIISPWFALFGKMTLSHESLDQSCTKGEDSLAAGWKKPKWFFWLLPCPDLLWPLFASSNLQRAKIILQLVQDLGLAVKGMRISNQ